jgi:surfactin synthase thioesterase subunit
MLLAVEIFSLICLFIRESKIKLIKVKEKSTMSSSTDIVWINTNPKFKRFEQPILRQLSQQLSIAHWEYQQHQDEPSCLEIALVLLHDYLKLSSHTVHLVGHGTGGLLGLLYARKHPERVKSLTLLGVGVYPAVDWQAHYYALREILPCSREIILAQMVQKLFGHQNKYNVKGLIDVLEEDLKTSPSPHSLYKRVSIPSGGVDVPLMVCGSRDDTIIDVHALAGWQDWLKEGDRLWECPQGHHFFHYFYPQQVSRQIFKFWRSIAEKEQERENQGQASISCPIQ